MSVSLAENIFFTVSIPEGYANWFNCHWMGCKDIRSELVLARDFFGYKTVLRQFLM